MTSQIIGLLEDLAAANHVLYDQGVLDAFGHVSSRDPTNVGRFVLSRNLSPALITSTDLLFFDLRGTVQVDNAPSLYLERFIHAAIYRARPDVNGIVHSHAASVLPFGLVPSQPLCPICHMSGFLRHNTPIFEIREEFGESTDLLVSSNEIGDRLSQKLADHPVILMRGHGMTVVGENVRQAVFRAVYTEANARIQMSAKQLGPEIYLTEAEAAAADTSNNGQIDRAWDFWTRRAEINIRRLTGT